MPGWDCLRDRAGGFSAASAAIFFAPPAFVPARFFLPALMGDQKQNSRAGDWFIAAHLAAFRPRFPG
jgi:hypothetical protein